MGKDQEKQLSYGDISESDDSLRTLKLSKSLKAMSNKKIITDTEVYKLLLDIPSGRVSTYGDIAKILGNPSASRVIGNILGKNPNPIDIPCHRVVLSNGKIGGYIHGVAKKRELLEKEGVSFTSETTIYNFENIRFHLDTKDIN
jgi:methylated-DNA-[protein]-cysteine S-methyltransferase